MTLSQTLQCDLQQIAAVLPVPKVGDPAIDSFREKYLAYLALLYSVVKASVPLMQRALVKCDHASDQVLINYLEIQIEEEADHDVWLLEDAAAISSDLTRFSTTPSRPVLDLVGSQYYIIEHVDKVGLLGYILALESHPPDPSAIRRAAEASQIPQRAFRTLEHHGDVDSSHVNSLARILDALALSAEQSALIHENAINTSVRMRSLLCGRQ